MVENLPAMQETRVPSLCQEDALEKGMATRSIILVWRIPFPSPGDLPYPGIEPRSPALQEDSLPAEPQGKPLYK